MVNLPYARESCITGIGQMGGDTEDARFRTDTGYV